MHPYRVFQHRVIVVEEHVHRFRVLCQDAFFDFVKLMVRIIMGIPPGPPMDTLVHDPVAHHRRWQPRGVDAHEKHLVGLPPGSQLLGKKGGMPELDRELLRPYLTYKLFKPPKISKRRWKLDQIIMDTILERQKQFFEPLETLKRCTAEFLKMRDGTVHLHDPGKTLPFHGPGFHHVRVREPVEAHVQLDRVQP